MTGIPTARGVDHVGITVPHLDEAVAYFVEVVGAREVYRGPALADDPDGNAFERYLDVHPRAVLQVAMTRWGQHQNVELLEYRAPGQSVTVPGNADNGAVHLAIDVDDIDAAWSYVRDDPRSTLLGDGPQRIQDGVNDGMSWFYFRTPWGLVIECSSRSGSTDWGCSLHRSTRWSAEHDEVTYEVIGD